MTTNPSKMLTTQPAQLADFSMPNLCHHCKKFASQICNGCQNTPGHTRAVYYCNADCQKRDWVDHKEFCKASQAQKRLYRAGNILQDIFYVYREKVLERFGIKIEGEGGKMYVHNGENEPITSEWRLKPFPSDLRTEAQDKHALLTHMACEDASSCMFEMIRYFISDLSSQILEHTVATKNSKCRIVVVNLIDGKADNVDDYHHQFFQVSLKNGGGDFALDLTGAQDGYFDPVVPWSTFFTSRIDYFVPDNHNQKFGTSKKHYESKKNGPGLKGSFYKVNLQAGCKMCEALRAWEEENKTTSSEILKLSEEAFDRVRGELVERIRKELLVFVNELASKAGKAPGDSGK